MNQKSDIKNLTKKDLIQWLQDKGIRSYRAGQVFKWIYIRQADSFETMTDIGKKTRTLLSSHFTVDRLETVETERSVDGSEKILFRLMDGNHIETVLIPEKNHHTLCISTQVGCAQSCRFCLTARDGFVRNLTSGEIIAQIRDVKNSMEHPELLKNVVLMGMGEPLANYDNVIKALDTITDGDHGLKLSTRKVTVSTAGLIPKFPDLGRDTRVNFAISLNATDNKTRSMLMPINRKYPIEDLIKACRRYPLSPRQKLTFEYILIKGINDSLDHARCLAKLLRPVKAKINLIPFNESPESEFQRPDDKVVNQFLKELHDSGYTAIIRHSKGRDISAACGQLRIFKEHPGGKKRLC
ncbi:MAG: 23S rRNA (adenine(2503)-C(2))-methyltransferase RlmN [Desulfobacterales bacterium]